MNKEKQKNTIKPSALWYERIEAIFKTNFEELIPAEKTKVSKVTIQNGEISAKINIGLSDSFDTSISFSELSSLTTKKLIEHFVNDPISALLIDYPESFSQLLPKLEENNINILPETLEDIKINCSCESSICGHAVLLLQSISKKIAKKPSLLFSIRECELDQIITKAGYLPPLQEITTENEYSSKNNDTSNITDSNLTLSDFPTCSISRLFEALDDNLPGYAKGAHKQKLVEIYDTILSEYENINIYESPIVARNTNFTPFIARDKTLKFFVSPANNFLAYVKTKGSRIKISRDTLKIPVIDKETQEVSVQEQEGLILPADFVFEYFLSIMNSRSNAGNSESAEYFKKAIALSLNIIKSASFLPEFTPGHDNLYSIKYGPLNSSQAIQNAISQLYVNTPEHLMFEEAETKLIKNKSGKILLTEITTFLIERLFFLKRSLLYSNTLLNAFIKENTYNAKQAGEKESLISIYEWLRPVLFKNFPFKLVLKLQPTASGQEFRITPEICFNDNIENTIPFSKLFDDSNDEISEYPINLVKTKICKQVLHAAYYMPLLERVVSSKGLYTPVIGLKDVADTIINLAPVLNELGINILAPKELQDFSKIRVSLKMKSKSSKNKNLKFLFESTNPNTIKLEELLEFSYEIAIGDKTLSKEEFLELVNSSEGLVQHNGQYLLLKEDEINSIIQQLSKQVNITNSDQLLMAGITGIYQDFEFNVDEAIKNALDEYTEIKDIQLPENLKGTLRPYQEKGYKWLYSNYLRSFGSCIADDMGLGKTIQVLSFILKLKEEGKLNNPALVVCPTTLLGNWVKECEKFTPSLNVAIYHGSDRDFQTEGIDIIITTYALARIDSSKFESHDWSILIIDEAQNIKNPETSQAKTIKSIKAQNYIAMTGTPVENRLSELWSIFDFLNKGYLGTRGDFHNVYSVPIERFKDTERINRLKKVTSPFILRRLKTDKAIISDLPEKNVIDEFCYLSKEQAALYEKTLKSCMSSIENTSGINRRGNIFKLITALKQICNHPVHYTKTGNLCRDLSGKADTTLTILDNIIESDEKALIFSQYKEMGQLLVNLLKKDLNQDALFFHGSLQRHERENTIEKFQSDDKTKLMVLSLKAGGTGLNLTEASNVIHYDLWWNPAVEEQATDRTYRIGQTKNVNVYRLITLGTFEEKIDAKIKAKKELADLTIGTSENWISELSNNEIRDLFSLSQY